MKRDLDLIRSLLLYFEDRCKPGEFIGTSVIQLESYSAEDISYHISLLIDANFIEARDITGLGEIPNWVVTGMTWKGHDFLGDARDPKHWAKAKGIMKDAGSASLDVVKFILSEIIKTTIQSQIGKIDP